MTKRAQSEVIGVILLTAVIVILTVLAGGVILESVDSQAEPSVNLDVSIDASNVTISHHGGATLTENSVTIILQSEKDERYSLDSFYYQQGTAASSFNSGEILTHTHNATDTVRVLVVHDSSNSILYDRSFDVPNQSLENESPIVNFSFTPSTPSPGETVTFDASSSVDPDGSISTYEWTFDDGTAKTTTDPTINHAYDNNGSYAVTLKVTDDDGASDSKTRIVAINATRPTIENATLADDDGNRIVTGGDGVTISATVSDAGSGVSTVTADASSLDAGVVDLNDGDNDGTYTASVTLGSSPTEGEQEVTIEAIDNAGNTNTATTNTVTVDTTPPEISTFSVVDKSEFNSIFFYWEFVESFRIQWEATDERLDETTVYINRSGTVQDTYSGQSGDETYDNTRFYETSGREHTITIVAIDEAGNQACRVVTDTADGDDPPDTAYGSC